MIGSTKGKKRRTKPGVPTAEEVLPGVRAARDEAVRELRHEEAVSRGYAALAAAALALLEAGAVDRAKDVLRTAKGLDIDRMRYRVAHEPGGIAYAGTWEPRR